MRDSEGRSHKLTKTQARVLELVASGLENEEIASETGVSKSAVRQVVSRLIRKFNGRN